MSITELISNQIEIAVSLNVGIRIVYETNKILLYMTDYQAYVEQYLIPEQVYEANKWLKRSPRNRIIIP